MVPISSGFDYDPASSSWSRPMTAGDLYLILAPLVVAALGMGVALWWVRQRH